MKKYAAMIIAMICVMTLAGGCALLPFSEDNPLTKEQETAKISEEVQNSSEPDETEETEKTEKTEKKEKEDQEEDSSILDEAEKLAAMYDYDGAIQLLKEQPDYETNTGMQDAVTEYTKTK